MTTGRLPVRWHRLDDGLKARQLSEGQILLKVSPRSPSMSTVSTRSPSPSMTTVVVAGTLLMRYVLVEGHYFDSEDRCHHGLHPEPIITVDDDRIRPSGGSPWAWDFADRQIYPTPEQIEAEIARQAGGETP